MNILRPEFTVSIGINDITIGSSEQTDSTITGSCVGYIDLVPLSSKSISDNINREKVLSSHCLEGRVIFEKITNTNIITILDYYNVSEETAKAAATLYQLGMDEQAQILLNHRK